MAVGACEQVIVLVPGFLSFDAEGTSPSSRNRVAPVLRSALEAHCGVPIRVVTLPPSPATSLAQRQRELFQNLATLDGVLRGVRQFHLVGHGPGGLDAELLTASLPQSTSATWPELDPTHLRMRIASVTTLAAPHYGTQLAEQPAFCAWQAPLSAETRGFEQAGTLAAALAARWRSTARRSSMRREAGDHLAALRLVLRLLGNRGMPSDLCPHSMQALRVHNTPDLGLPVRVLSIVTAAPDLGRERDGSPREPDELFAALHDLTRQPPLVCPSRELMRAEQLLKSFPRDRIIRHPSALVPELNLTANDGLVNSARQLLLNREQGPDTLAAVVIADHADVLGYYDPPSALPLKAGAPAMRGLLRSGAHFGDDQFFHLWGLIAARIAALTQDSRIGLAAAQ